MRDELKAAGAVEALVPLLRLTADGAELRYVPLPTNEYLWSMRAVAKLVGQDEVSAVTAERRGIRWLLSGRLRQGHFVIIPPIFSFVCGIHIGAANVSDE